ncbi:MAG: DMT family transporter [Elusimicrobiota bacterium]
MFSKKMADIGLFYCAFIWGSTFVVTKYALNCVDSSAMVAIRFFISALALLPFVLRKKNFFAHIKEAFVLSFFLASLYLTQTAGLLYTSASNSGFITGLFIIFIPLFLFIFKGEKTGKTEFWASLTAVAGMWFLTGGIKGINKGDLLTLVAAMSYSAHLLFTDKYVKGGYDITKLAFHQFWMVGLISSGAVFMSGNSFYVSGLNGWLIIFFLAFFPTLSAFFIQMNAQKYSDPFKVGIIFTLEPVFAAAFAWTVGGEDFFAIKALGGFLIFSAMIINEVGKLKGKNIKNKEA